MQANLPTPWLSQTAAREFLGATQAELDALRRGGFLRAERAGLKWLFPVDSLESAFARLLAARRARFLTSSDFAQIEQTQQKPAHLRLRIHVLNDVHQFLRATRTVVQQTCVRLAQGGKTTFVDELARLEKAHGEAAAHLHHAALALASPLIPDAVRRQVRPDIAKLKRILATWHAAHTLGLVDLTEAPSDLYSSTRVRDLLSLAESMAVPKKVCQR